MNSITSEQLSELLTHFSADVHELLIRQLSLLSALIITHQEAYSQDEGFRRAMDLILVNVMHGKFLPEGVSVYE